MFKVSKQEEELSKMQTELLNRKPRNYIPDESYFTRIDQRGKSD